MSPAIKQLANEIEKLPNLFFPVSREDCELFSLIPKWSNKREKFKKSGIPIEVLLTIAKFKSKRKANFVLKNSDHDIAELTKFALSATGDTLKMRALCALSGVGPGTASAILAWTEPEAYGVIDIRDWNSLSFFKIEGFTRKENSVFSIDDWILFINIIRDISEITKRLPQEIDFWLYRYNQELEREKKGEGQ